LTADALQGTREALLGCGFDGYLSKPIVIADQLKTLEQVITL